MRSDVAIHRQTFSGAARSAAALAQRLIIKCGFGWLGGSTKFFPSGSGLHAVWLAGGLNRIARKRGAAGADSPGDSGVYPEVKAVPKRWSQLRVHSPAQLVRVGGP